MVGYIIYLQFAFLTSHRHARLLFELPRQAWFLTGQYSLGAPLSSSVVCLHTHEQVTAEVLLSCELASRILERAWSLLSGHWTGLSPHGTALMVALVFVASVLFLVNTGTQPPEKGM